MKKVLSILMILCMICALSACGTGTTSNENNSTESIASTESGGIADTEEDRTAEPATAPDENEVDNVSGEKKSKILIAYFSRADENYSVGVVEKGNTEIIAEMIAGETGGDLFHIERDTPYPADYDECTDEAKTEQNNNARPALKEDIDISDYDFIFLGYPIWWGDLPMPVYTFLEAHDFSGKTVIPFCTHAGSGLSTTESSIENITGATMLEGLAIAGITAQKEQEDALASVKTWLGNMNLSE